MKDYLGSVMILIGLVVGVIGLATKLTELNDSQLLRIVIILSYFIFAGGIIWFAYYNVSVSQNLRLFSLALLYLLTIPFFLWVGGWTKTNTFDPCREFGITMNEPVNGYALVDEGVTIQGRYTKRPPEGSLRLVGIADNQYWPYNLEEMELTDTGWTGRAYGRGEFTALVTYAGENSQILFDHYLKAGEITGDYTYGIDKKPSDLIECDRVFISTP